MSELVIGIDASTTAVKAMVFDLAGQLVAEGRCPLTLENPATDAWEQDAESWWTSLLTALGAAVSAIDPTQRRAIRSLSIAHQRETFVLTDQVGTPLRPAVVWMDSRCRPEVREAIATFGADALHRLTGKPACVTPSFYKAMFLLHRHDRSLIAKKPRLLDVHAFLVWRLTGEFATSLASADPLGLIDLERADWSDALLAALGLDRRSVPRLVAAGAAIGTLLPEVADAVGLDRSTQVIAGAGDGQAAGLGAGILAPGRAYLNLGTALVSGVASPTIRIDRAFRTLFGAAPGTYLLETDLKGGTFTIGWLLDKWLRPRDSSATDRALLEALEVDAANLPPGARGLMLVPYWNGVMNPYWDDDATGAVIGFRGDHGPAHFYRAILEGLAFEQRLHSRAVEQHSGEHSEAARIDQFVVMGGGATSDLFCRILADVLDRTIVRSLTAEATCLGAAMLAAIGCNLHTNASNAARAMTGDGRTFEPGADRITYQRLYDEVYRSIYPALRDPMAHLRAIS